MSNKASVDAAIAIAMTVGYAIRQLGRVPNGHLYAQLCGHLNYEQYSAVIRILKESGLVDEIANELIWVGVK